MRWRWPLCAVLAIGLVACTGAEGSSTGAASGAPTEVRTITASGSSGPAAPQAQIVDAYRTYTAAVGDALARGRVEPAVRDVAAGQALRDLRARVRANRGQGFVASGELTPSATVDQVTWDGAGAAQLTDCVLNGLAHVDADDADAVEVEATGTRRPVEAVLEQVDGAWVVTEVEMPQDPDAENPQTDPPFLRGPMPDGPPSCAPPDIEREVLAGYRAFWDAFDRAFGFGRDGAADPDDPGLAATSVDPQLSESRRFLEQRRADDVSIEGDRDQRRPWLLALTDSDTSAVVADCVQLGRSRTLDADGRTISRSPNGQLDLEEARLVRSDGEWKVAGWTTTAEGVAECEPPA